MFKLGFSIDEFLIYLFLKIMCIYIDSIVDYMRGWMFRWLDGISLYSFDFVIFWVRSLFFIILIFSIDDDDVLFGLEFC